MTRWIVNPSSRAVRSYWTPATAHLVPAAVLEPGEFFYDAPTAADAMMAGERHLLAQDCLSNGALFDETANMLVVVADRIEPKSSSMKEASELSLNVYYALHHRGYDVWREGVAIVVLRGPK